MADLAENEAGGAGQYRDNLLRNLQKLIEAGKTGRFDAPFPSHDLSGEDAEILRYMDEAIDDFVRRDAILHTINEMAEIFCSHEKENFDDVMSQGLKPFAEALDLDRVAVYRLLDKNPPKIGQVYLWSGKTIPIEDSMVEVPKLTATDRWLDALVHGNCINADVSKVPEDEAAFLRRFGCKAAYFVPIFTRGEFWGIITLEDHTTYRTFGDEDLEFLESAAHLCASAVVRNEIEREREWIHDTLERHDKMLAALNEMAFVLLSHEDKDFDDVMSQGIRPVADAVGIDRVSVYQLIDVDAMRLKQIYVWYESIAPLDIDIVEVPRVPATERWHDTLKSGKCLNEDVSKVSEVEAAFFDQFGVKAVCFVPVFIKGAYWGIIALGDHTRYRYFDEDSMDIMRSAAHLCALAIMRRDIEREVAEKNEQLEATLIKAQEASRAKSEFLSRMSHEMRTPMNAIIGSTQVAKIAGDEQKRAKHLESIDTASRELLRLIDDVLDVTRIEYGTFKLVPAAFDWGAMTGDIQQMIARITSEKQQSFACEIDPSIPSPLIGDEKRLRQILVSLLVNAVKYTPSGGEVRLAIREVGRGGAGSGEGGSDVSRGGERGGDAGGGGGITLLFEISDNGIGIAKEKQGEIFNLFEQLDGGIARKHGGIGIGLALSKLIVARMGGGMRLESELGMGSKFSFTCTLEIA